MINLDHISFSSLKNFIKCPKLFEAEKILKINPFFGNEHTILGTGVHETFEYYFKNHKKHTGTVYKKLQEISRDIIDQESCRLAEKGLLLDEFLLEKTKKMSDNMIKNSLPRFVNFLGPRATVLNTELEIKYPLSELFDTDLTFELHIDLVTQRIPSEIIIWDYKTSRGSWKNDKKFDLEQITSQLLLYKYFYCKTFNIVPKNVRTYFVIMNKVPPYGLECWEATYTIGQLNKMLDYIKLCAEAIKNNNFPCTEKEDGCVEYVNMYGKKYMCKHFEESSSKCKLCV